MFGLKIFVRVQTFWQVPLVLPCNFCHPANYAAVCLSTSLNAIVLLCLVAFHCSFVISLYLKYAISIPLPLYVFEPIWANSFRRAIFGKFSRLPVGLMALQVNRFEFPNKTCFLILTIFRCRRGIWDPFVCCFRQRTHQWIPSPSSCRYMNV